MIKTDKKTMGERLHDARTDRGWSQEYLAQRVGVTKKAISKIERGDTREPSARNLGNIAEALRVSVRWLMYGERQQPRNQEGTGAAMSMIDCEILAQLEVLTDAQKQEALKRLKEQADENREVLEAYKSRQD